MGILGGSQRNKEPKSGIFSEWLETLQQESWQLELLISGFALLGVWGSKRFINNLDIFKTLHIATPALDTLMGLLVFVLNIGWFIFLTNLLVHIILRGFWIGAIGLRYVSGEIDYEELGYSEYFTQYLKKKVGSYDDFIERLERLCSIIFAFTFLLFFLFISVLIYFAGFTIIVFISGKLFSNSQNHPGFIILVFTYLILGIIMLIDFLSFGGLKKLNPGIGEKMFAGIFKFMSLITLSFLYRPLLYNFLDDKYTRRLILLSIPYFIFLIFIFPLTSIQSYPFFPTFSEDHNSNKYTSENSVLWYYYDDLRTEHQQNSLGNFQKKKVIRFASLSSFNITDDYATLFLRQMTNDAKRIEKKEKSSAFHKSGLRHMFMGREAEDSIFTAMNKKMLDDYAAVRRFKKNNLSLYSEARWNEIQDSTIKANDYKREIYGKEKLENNLKAFKSFFDVKLDGNPILDQSICKYYVHPNAGENGLLCFLNMQNIETGPHELRIAKKMTVGGLSKKDSLIRYIPFLKL